MLVTSIDPLAAYKVSDDPILELMSVTASVEDDSEGASMGSRLSNLTNWPNTGRTEGICSTTAKSK
jgi:hypothetical protein